MDGAHGSCFTVNKLGDVMTMKRLFMLRHSKGGAVLLGDDKSPVCFPNKRAAKVARDSLGGNVVVTLGIDHRLYNKGVK